jgi:hypothetical protein
MAFWMMQMPLLSLSAGTRYMDVSNKKQLLSTMCVHVHLIPCAHIYAPQEDTLLTANSSPLNIIVWLDVYTYVTPIT